MSRIDTLQIYNFKFFDEQEPIKLGGKHLLLYGENGSGKSSIYWALYTLFEASLKDSEEIKKYFKHYTEHEESLLNIHSDPIYTGESLFYDSFIEIKTTHATPQDYKISILDTSINTNTIAQEINQSSDFISYKVLYKFQDFWNGERMDLANIFIGNILPYIAFPKKDLIRDGKSKSFTNAYDMYYEIKQGPGRVYKNSIENSKYNIFYNSFNESLIDLVDFINANAPQMLRDLGYDIDFKLNYYSFKTRLSRFNFYFTPFKLEFVITSYLGKKITINRPQSFLNEAKIAAIAIAIRLTILKKRINEAAPGLLKFIVFDDVMISLDMNNRDRLIDFLLDGQNKFTEDYQLLFLTHDRSLFNYLKDKIRNVGLRDEFVYKEVYVDTISEFEKPSIYDSPNKLKKAKYYLEKHDYPACGIYLRTMCEEILDRLYPDPLKYEIKRNNEGLFESSQQNLNDKINHLEYFCKIENLDYSKFKDLKTYKSVVLNTLAHNDITSPLYRIELEKVYNVLIELDKIKRDIQLSKNGKTFKVNFVKSDGNPYTVGITLKDSLMLLEDASGEKRISNFCKTNITYINDNGTETRDINIEKESITQIASEKCTELEIPTVDIHVSTIDRTGNSLAYHIQNV